MKRFFREGIFVFLFYPIILLFACINSFECHSRSLSDLYLSDSYHSYVLLDEKRTFNSQVNNQNTVYDIRSHFNLQGKTVLIPKGSVLLFNGGSLGNGTISFNDCVVEAAPYRIFGDDVVLKGFFSAQRYSPEWFGAIGNSIHDDAPAIQRLIDCGLPVYLGPKTYCIKKAIKVSNSTTIQGVGYSSVIKAIGCNAVTSNSSSKGVLLSNFRIVGDKSVGSSGIVFEYPMPKMVIDNLHISNFGLYGIFVKQSWDYSIRNVNVSENGNGLFAEYFNSSTIDKIVAYRNEGYGIVIISSANARISGTVQENGLTGLSLKACLACDVSVYGEQNGFKGKTNEDSSEIVLSSGGKNNEASALNSVQFYLNGGKGSTIESKYGLYLNWAHKNTISGLSIRHLKYDIYETTNSENNILTDTNSSSKNMLTIKNRLLSFDK